MSIKSLARNWALPNRTKERQQVTLRISYDIYAQLHALKEVYPERSVNDFIEDILRTGLDEIIEALPIHQVTEQEAQELAFQFNEPITEYIGSETGLGVTFRNAYRKILQEKTGLEAEQESQALKVVQ